MSEGGMVHNWNMGASSSYRFFPTICRCKKIVSKSNSVLSPTCMPRFSRSIVFTWLEILAWNPDGRQLRNEFAMFSSISTPSLTMTWLGRTWILSVLYSTSLLIDSGQEYVFQLCTNPLSIIRVELLPLLTFLFVFDLCWWALYFLRVQVFDSIREIDSGWERTNTFTDQLTVFCDIIMQTGKYFEANKFFSSGVNWHKIKKVYILLTLHIVYHNPWPRKCIYRRSCYLIIIYTFRDIETK